MDKLASFAVVWLPVYFVLTVLLGSYGWPGFFIKGFIGFWPAIAAARAEWPIWSNMTHALASSSSASAVIPASKKITVFGEAIDRPEFFDAIYAKELPAFTAWAYWTAKDRSTVSCAVLIASSTELWQRRMLEAMWESARLERVNRGYPIKDRLNNVQWPEIHPQGILVEMVDNDDGTRSAILAIGITKSLRVQEWEQANANGFGQYRSAWQEAPHPKGRIEGRQTNRTFTVKADVMPLFHLKLTEIVIQGDQAVDPIARKDGGVSYSFPEEWR